MINGITWVLNQGCGPDVTTTVTLAAVADGTSNTSAFSEWVKGTSGSWASVLGTCYNNVGNTGSDFQDQNACQNQTGQSWDYKGEYWICGDAGRGGGYHHVATPNKKSCNCAAAAWDPFVTASSNHSNGVNAVFLDGSVHFVHNSVAPNVWQAVGTRQRNEVVSTNDL